jgi:twitching motility protein PilU
MLDELLREMVARGATDLYLTDGSPPVLSTEGSYIRLETVPLTGAVLDEILSGAVSAPDLEEFRRTHELNVAVAVEGGDRFRINAHKQRGETGLVIRRIQADIPSLDQLGLPPAVGNLAMLPRGMVLITGATGSGKSTTMAAMIDRRNSHAPGHIITIEDPIEYVHAHKRSIVTQREVGLDTHSFHDALHNAFRQAPTVVLIGEIRDRESISAALRFAETGHLVLATLHSTNASQTIERIVSLHPPGMEQQVLLQLALTLKGVVSQRLVPRRDGTGRVPAVEVLLHTARVEEIIKEGRIDELREAAQTGTGEGMQTFDQALFALYRAGLITEDDALAHAESQNDLRLRIHVEGIEDDGECAAESEIKIDGYGLTKRRRLR